MINFEYIFTASDSFNIHIERDRSGLFQLFRRTGGEKWDIISSLPNRDVIDMDIYNNREREYKILGVETPVSCTITFIDGTIEYVKF